MCGTSLMMALKVASTGPLPVACTVSCRPSPMSSVSVADCGPMVPAITVQRHHLHAVLGGGDLLVDQRLQILVVDVLLAVGQRLEAVEGVLERVSPSS